jgi:hypothetical protein
MSNKQGRYSQKHHLTVNTTPVTNPRHFPTLRVRHTLTHRLVTNKRSTACRVVADILNRSPALVNARDHLGRSCLHHAVSLLSPTRHFQPNITYKSHKHDANLTTIWQAAKGHVGIARMLLIRGADASAKVFLCASSSCLHAYTPTTFTNLHVCAQIQSCTASVARDRGKCVAC